MNTGDNASVDDLLTAMRNAQREESLTWCRRELDQFVDQLERLRTSEIPSGLVATLIARVYWRGHKDGFELMLNSARAFSKARKNTMENNQ